jgi:diguanylate cyclase (GGDEF)-like protein
MPQPGEAFEMMPSGEASQPQPSAEDSFLDLFAEALEGLDGAVRRQFLQQFFRTIAQIDLTETQSNEYWDRILQRRRELVDNLGRRVSLKTAMVEVLASMVEGLASTNFLRVPVLIEYDEFKKLQINAATDALTGLYNRRLFDEYCDKELNRAKRHGQHLAVVILDLQGLKGVNDRHGHLHGDQVLQLAATTLHKTLRASDFAFRLGGDEFALLLPQTEPEQAVTLCRRLRAQYQSDVRPLKLDTAVTLDFGIAVHPLDGDQKGQLMDVADKRLYASRGTPLRSPRPLVFPLESHNPPEAPTPPSPSSPKTISAPGPEASLDPSPPTPSENRKWERVSLAGTKAHAVLTDVGRRTAAVIDLSTGGVALLLDEAEDVPMQFSAVLHVPILRPVQVVLRKTYALRTENGRTRVGSSFVS